MMNSRKRKAKEKLINQFGLLKDDSFDFELIDKYFRKKNNTDALQVLSDKTCNDLDFNELFAFIDRTNSKVGQQYLYNKLRTIPHNLNETALHERLIVHFTENKELRLNFQTLLGKLNDLQAYYITTLFQDEHVKPPKWGIVFPILSLTSLLSLILLFFIPKIFLVLFAVFIINMIIHYWNKQNLYQYLGSLPELLKLNNVASELFKNSNLKETNPELANSIKIIDSVKKRMLFFNIEAKLQGDFEAIFWAILELIKILFLLEPLLLFGVLKKLDTKRKEIEVVFVFVGQVDCLISIASLRAGLKSYCTPAILLETKQLNVLNAYHPLINNCVSNSININSKSILLTGSNMSGKTSFIRTIGINVLTGLTLNTCFAEQFSMPRTTLFSAIRISDDLTNNKSYYFEEVVTIKEMICNSGNGRANLFLLDEIFKGTNTIERISAGKAVLSELSLNDNIVFVSTHDIELANLLKHEYELYHFSEKIDDKAIDFDYKLKEGKLKNRNAIRILQINDYPENIIKEAIELSNVLESTV